MIQALTSPTRALFGLPVLIGLMIAALVASPVADAHKKRSWQYHGKSGWHKKQHHSKPGTVSVVGGKTKLSVDAGTAAALGSLGVAVEPIRPAYTRRGSFKFPITGGEVDPKTLAGQIGHSGGLAFEKGSTRVALTDFVINIDADPDLTAMVGGSRVSILSLDLSNLERRDRHGKVYLSGIEASLTAGAAAALNAAFSTTAFEAGLLIGTAKLKAYVHKAYDRPRGDDDDDDDDDDDRHRGRDDDDDDDDDD
jgi:hypothetical protein